MGHVLLADACPYIHRTVYAEHGVPGEAIAEAYDKFEKGQVMQPLAAAAVSNQTIQESMKLLLLVRAYQVTRMTLCSWTACSSCCLQK